MTVSTCCPWSRRRPLARELQLVQCSLVQYSRVEYSIVYSREEQSTVQYAILYSTILYYGIVYHCIVQHSIVQYSITQEKTKHYSDYEWGPLPGPPLKGARIYIYIYIYIQRERERCKQRERECAQHGPAPFAELLFCGGALGSALAAFENSGGKYNIIQYSIV